MGLEGRPDLPGLLLDLLAAGDVGVLRALAAERLVRRVERRDGVSAVPAAPEVSGVRRAEYRPCRPCRPCRPLPPSPTRRWSQEARRARNPTAMKRMRLLPRLPICRVRRDCRCALAGRSEPKIAVARKVFFLQLSLPVTAFAHRNAPRETAGRRGSSTQSRRCERKDHVRGRVHVARCTRSDPARTPSDGGSVQGIGRALRWINRSAVVRGIFLVQWSGGEPALRPRKAAANASAKVTARSASTGPPGQPASPAARCPTMTPSHRPASRASDVLRRAAGDEHGDSRNGVADPRVACSRRPRGPSPRP